MKFTHTKIETGTNFLLTLIPQKTFFLIKCIATTFSACVGEIGKYNLVENNFSLNHKKKKKNLLK